MSVIYCDQYFSKDLFYPIIEAAYLGYEIDTSLSKCSVFVNPDNTTYILHKVVIISNPSYPSSKILELLNNNCRIISRIKVDLPHVLNQPYILRPAMNVMWNGSYISESDLDLEGDDHLIVSGNVRLDDGVLYFPKIKNPSSSLLMDEHGNLTALGWVQQQVGLNIDLKTPYQNLDILKLSKGFVLSDII